MPLVSRPVQELLRLLSSPSELRQIAPELNLEGAPRAVDATPPGLVPADESERDWLIRDGFAALAGVLAEPAALALAAAIDALRARELPAAFLYAFDETWALGELVRARISALTGHTYTLVEDVWAWRIAPGEGGWPPHRGIGHARLDRRAPEILNVWIALREATADRACMHAIPLDEDPGYPDELARVDGPLTAVRALPVHAGDALFWNANLLHWGGRCAARAAGPRVSCSFSLCRSDAAARFPDLAVLPPGRGLELVKRADLLARMILLYGAGQPDVSDVVREWAAITHGLATRFSSS
jgi:hypothetical protein